MSGQLFYDLISRNPVWGPFTAQPDGGSTPLEKEQHTHWRLGFDEQNIAWLLLDQKDSAVNLVSEAVLSELEHIIDRLEQKKPQGIVLRSAKDKGFCAGADITEFSILAREAEIIDKLTRANATVNRFEQLDAPKVAVIHGHCLGGGLELALCCDCRLAVSGAIFGFPEIRLGLHPGLGGTVRLTRLIDPLEAMTLMLAGKAIDANRAKQLGLVESVIEERHLPNALATIFGEGLQRNHHSLKVKLLTTRVARQFEGRQMLTKSAEKATPEQYPAPAALIELWQQHGGDAKAMMKAETESFARLLGTHTAKGLIRVFLAGEALKATAKANAPSPAGIRQVHVIGAGAMGGDIAGWCAFKGYRVSLYDSQMKTLADAVHRARKLCVAKNLSAIEQRDVMDRLMPDFTNSAIGKADLIIEAVPEDVGIKQALYQDIEPKMKPGAILATNTSSIPLQALCASLTRPGQFVGLHFFNPVAKMKLVEVVAHEQSDQAILASVHAFVNRIDKLPAPVSSAPGFLVNRVLTPYLLEAMVLLDEGISKDTIDRTAEAFGMPLGPIELADRIGLDVCLSVAGMLRDRVDFPMAGIPAWMNEKIENGEYGKKTGKGLCLWKDGDAQKNRHAKIDATLTDRLILPMLNACMACLQEKVIENETLLDGAMVFGTGFAPFLGGPLHYARQRGFDDIRMALETLATQHGARFQPHQGWLAQTA